MSDESLLLGGRYEVDELIGRGGMAEVHRGHDTRLGRAVAIKMLRTDLARDSSFIKRFRREAQASAGLNHHAIVAVYDSGEDHVVESGGAEVSVPYMVMEFVEGRTLRDVLSEETKLESDSACRVTEGVLDALAYSHRTGIVHRDIKPANVMITDDGGVKVMDFGIARAVADAAATMTQTQAVIGTAQYLSPEQAQGLQVDERSDLYSTGCLLYELLTGRPPFVGDSPVSIAYQHVGEQPVAPSVFEDSVSPAIDAVVLHSLIKDRDLRYQSAESFRSDLEAARLRRPVSVVASVPRPVVPETEQIRTPAPRTVAYSQVPPPAQPESLTASMEPVPAAPARSHRGRTLALTLFVLAALGLLGLGVRQYLENRAEAQLVSVPALVGKPLETAQALLQRENLRFETTESASTTVPQGSVISQDPVAGTRSDPDTVVIMIEVSTGPSATTVPNLVGRSQAEAEQLLRAEGLTVGTITNANSGDVAKGQVVSTEPAAGESADVNSAVNLAISTGQLEIPVVTGLTQAEALRTLAESGLQADTEYRRTPDVPANQVIEQTPPAGELIEAGGTIKIIVAQEPPPSPSPSPTSSSPSPSDSTSSSATASPSPTDAGQ